MKKFLLLMYGAMEPTPEAMAAMRAWFDGISEHIVDSGNPLGDCLEVARSGKRSIGPGGDAPVGYAILSAASIDDAARLVDSCPVGSVRLHEALPM